MENYKKAIKIKIGPIELPGTLVIPKNATAIVIFVHGSGSSHKSPRNIFVADKLNEAGFATLLFDLLTEEEDLYYQNRFDIITLAERLKNVTKWIRKNTATKNLKIGYFGASTGAAAAIVAAVELSYKILAIVSRGGRPDLADNALSQIDSPILLIVGGNDNGVISLNQEAYALIKTTKAIEIVPRATHLFEEAGALEKVADLAINWFKKYLEAK